MRLERGVEREDEAVGSGILTDGEREAFSGGKVRREDPMLGVVQGSVPDGSEDLADDEESVAVEVVRGCARHDYRAGQVEAGEDNGHDGPAPFVDVEAEDDAEERVDKVRHGDLRKGEF